MTTFPIDWNEWIKEWNQWRAAHVDALQPARGKLRGRNFMADEVIGTYRINGRTVELSEVTFPNLSDRDENGRLIERRDRLVGITYANGDETEAGPLVSSFPELEAALGLS